MPGNADRFTLNAVNDYLQAAFPPLLYAMEHVVINSMQQKELARRLGIPSQVIPNVLDFETPPPGVDDYNRDLRSEIGLRQDDWFILQPTRVVQRKGIEHAIEGMQSPLGATSTRPTASPLPRTHFAKRKSLAARGADCGERRT